MSMSTQSLPVATLLALGLAVAPAPAQNARSFVSANGLDANACTRPAPCRTLQGAHDKTNSGGEINMLDPAGYGPVTITKSISIVNDGVGSAGILVPPGGTGITINAGAGGVVNLRGLIVEGAGLGQTGIAFNTGQSLTVENSVVRNLASFGIALQPNASSSFAVASTLVSDNGTSAIFLAPTGSSIAVTAVFDRVELRNNGGSGIALNGQTSTGAINATVADSVASNNGNTGFFVLSAPGGASASLMVARSVAAHNAVGLYALQPNAVLRVGQSTVTGNVDAWVAGFGGVLQSYGDNRIDGNTNAVSETAPPITAEK